MRRVISSRGSAVFASLIGLWMVVATSVEAQRGQKVVLGPAEAEVGGDAVRKSAADALAEALRMQGMSVVFFEEAKKSMPRGESCDHACTERLLQLVSADLAGTVSISGDAEQGPQQAKVRLVDPAGHHFEGAAAVRDGDVRDATTRALLEARSFQLLGPGPWLQLDGTPEGAEVLIDGSVVGQLPYRAGVASGKHTLLVRDAGYSPFQKALDVPNDAGQRLSIKIALEPAPIEAPVAAVEMPADRSLPVQSASSDHTWLIAPIAIGAVGLGLATAATIRLGTALDACVHPDMAGHCTEKRTVHVWPTVAAYGLSAALIGSGLVWIVLGTQSERRTQLALSFDHVALSGSF